MLQHVARFPLPGSRFLPSRLLLNRLYPLPEATPAPQLGLAAHLAPALHPFCFVCAAYPIPRSDHQPHLGPLFPSLHALLLRKPEWREEQDSTGSGWQVDNTQEGDYLILCNLRNANQGWHLTILRSQAFSDREVILQ